jgi:DNA invertase Pin-like site-specific DNA recombinase
MYIGSVRVSTHEQNLALQQDALTHAGCKKIIVDQVSGTVAEFERQLLQERMQAGLRAARVRGRVGGRPKVLAPGKRQRAVQLYQAKQLTVKEICEMMGISKPTLYAYVRQAQASSPSNDTDC